ncbi:MAG: SMC-Scp complex subunit ScpB [Candidatus Falkowbacteria bacterium]|nr:SMC-Scp complex subunit ScpB [Candidatus Falkowbacteria bacterium]
MSLNSQLESLLFITPKALSLKELAKLTKAKTTEIEAALSDLSATYKNSGRGWQIISNNQNYQLTSAPENSELIREFLRDETSGELTQPSLEALTVIAYRGPVSKLELERIRGVNCSLIIRNLLLRGLIEENFNKQKNENYYIVSLEFIRFLGLRQINELPDYERLHQDPTLAEVLASSN